MKSVESWKEWDDDERVGDLTFEAGQRHISVELYVGGNAPTSPLLYRHVFGAKKVYMPETSYWMTMP